MIDIYLAIPYSIYNDKEREYAFETANYIAYRYVMEGKTVFSPISHSHSIAKYGTPASFDFWRKFDLEMLAVCKTLVVIMMPGWENSIGIKAEIEEAERLGMFILYRHGAWDI